MAARPRDYQKYIDYVLALVERSSARSGLGGVGVIVVVIVALALAAAGIGWYRSDGVRSEKRGATGEEQIVCTQETRQCPDGSYVNRVPPLCEFASCPQATQKSNEPRNLETQPPGTKPPSSYSPSKVKGWKTYRSEEYGFEFQYPPEIVLSVEQPETRTATFREIQSNGQMKTIRQKRAKAQLTVVGQSGKYGEVKVNVFAIDEYIRPSIITDDVVFYDAAQSAFFVHSPWNVQLLEPATYGGKEGWRSGDGDAGSIWEYIAFPNKENGTTVEFGFYYGEGVSRAPLDKILSTFVFLP